MIIQTLELRVVDNVDSWVPGEPVDVDVEFLRPLLRDHGPWGLTLSGKIIATRRDIVIDECCVTVHLVNQRAWDAWADAVPVAFRLALYRANDNDTERGHDPNLRAFLLDACGLA